MWYRGGGGNEAIGVRSTEGIIGVGGKPKSTIPVQESKDKGKVPKETKEELQKVELIHEMGNINHPRITSKSTFPILGKKAQEENESQGKGEEAMQWETVTPLKEDPVFVSNVGPSAKVDMGEGNLEKDDTVQGPMAMSYTKELGWIAENVGPKSEYWKRKARANQTEDLKENTTPPEVKIKNPSNVKRENLKRSKVSQISNVQSKENTNTDGGVAAFAEQLRRTQ